jgi:hypothetical protein
MNRRKNAENQIDVIRMYNSTASIRSRKANNILRITSELIGRRESVRPVSLNITEKDDVKNTTRTISQILSATHSIR